jgi:hypothetical protein
MKPLPPEVVDQLRKLWRSYRADLDREGIRPGHKKYKNAHFDYMIGVKNTLTVLGYQIPATVLLSLSSHRDFADNLPL